MRPSLPPDVLEFLRVNPEEVQQVKQRMADAEERRTRAHRRAEEAARIAAMPLEQCKGGGYGCGNMTPGGYACESCRAEYRDDPDAFK